MGNWKVKNVEEVRRTCKSSCVRRKRSGDLVKGSVGGGVGPFLRVGPIAFCALTPSHVVSYVDITFKPRKAPYPHPSLHPPLAYIIPCYLVHLPSHARYLLLIINICNSDISNIVKKSLDYRKNPIFESLQKETKQHVIIQFNFLTILKNKYKTILFFLNKKFKFSNCNFVRILTF